MSSPTTRDSLAVIAESLRRMADMMAADREEMRQAAEEQADYVDPVDCDHPREARYDNTDGAILRRGCHRCGADDISAYRKGAFV